VSESDDQFCCHILQDLGRQDLQLEHPERKARISSFLVSNAIQFLSCIRNCEYLLCILWHELVPLCSQNTKGFQQLRSGIDHFVEIKNTPIAPIIAKRPPDLACAEWAAK
jgi:hypothetical protein